MSYDGCSGELDRAGSTVITTFNVITLIVRYGLVVLFFPASVLDKVLNFRGAVKQSLQVFSSHSLAAALMLAGLFVELVRLAS